MSNQVEWRDYTIFGSEYEQQVSTESKYRHRPLNPSRLGFGEEKGIGPWEEGPDPNFIGIGT